LLKYTIYNFTQLQEVATIETVTNHHSEALETAVQLFKDIYQVTETWPRMQVFGLIMDIRRAAMGIATNLGEGQHQGMGPEFSEFLVISRQELTELKGHLVAAQENPALSAAGIEPLLHKAADLDGMLQVLAASLN